MAEEMRKESDKELEGKTVVFRGEECSLDPGDQRRDALKRRLDELQEEAEKISSELNIFKVDPSVMDPKKIPREVRRAINDNGEVWVSEADPNYRYAWIYRDPRWQWGGKWVSAAKVQGWEVVSGEMKEAKEHACGAAKERIISDCILMRIRLDHFLQLQERDRKKRRQRHESITSDLENLAAKHGVKVEHEIPSGVSDQMESQLAAQRRHGRGRRIN